jgi:hypothetical protein
LSRVCSEELLSLVGNAGKFSNKIYSQEIFLHLAGILCTGMPYNFYGKKLKIPKAFCKTILMFITIYGTIVL